MVRASYGLTFETFSPVERSEHLRADVALFVGFVAPRRTDPLADFTCEEHLRAWLLLYGFGAAVNGLEKSGKSVATLENVPVPIDGWSAFAQLFAWEKRLRKDERLETTYLGAAVRAFFAQGGRKAYIVRAGDPWARASAVVETGNARLLSREERLAKLVPMAAPGHAPAPTERGSWRGIEHLFGLADVSFVLVPDLPDVLDATEILRPLVEPASQTEEVFVTCSDEVTGAGERISLLRDEPPPACDEVTLPRWVEVVSAAVTFLRHPLLRGAQLVAAVPLLVQSGTAEASAENPLALFHENGWLKTRPPSPGSSNVEAFTSAFLQLATPWLKTIGSGGSPGEVEPPDGTLVGILARNALERGTFRNAAGLPVPFVFDFVPDVPRSVMLEPVQPKAEEKRDALNLLQRVCVIGRAPAGIQLLSDVTTSADEGYRSAGASRLIGAMLRAARVLGEDLAFDVSNEATWARTRDSVRAMLLSLWDMGALRGRTEEEAFSVRCDRGTMTDADIDAGRVIVLVQMEVAVALEAIRVVLTLTEGGRVSLLAGNGAS